VLRQPFTLRCIHSKGSDSAPGCFMQTVNAPVPPAESLRARLCHGTVRSYIRLPAVLHPTGRRPSPDRAKMLSPGGRALMEPSPLGSMLK
jgi:hypothetical protein